MFRFFSSVSPVHFCFVAIAILSGCASGTRVTPFEPGAVWPDDRGEHINAHGGGIYFEKGTYYWFGEGRAERASLGVNVYSSKNLRDWKYEGIALAPVDGDPEHDIARGCIMERPKVLYNEKTGKYVMWFHLELRGQGYNAARAGVAVSDHITGPYRFVHSFRPNGNMSRDMTLYKDNDGSAYHIYASRDNYDLRISRLSDDYLTPTRQDTLISANHREAPAIFKRQGTYYLITSGCTGWKPNAASYYTAKSVWGPWEKHGNPARGVTADTTFGAQSTFVFPVPGRKDDFVFMADLWNPSNLKDSRHVWLPIRWEGDTPYIEWLGQWDFSTFDRKN